ncbi:phage baseplate assembly protein domain-containing protein [Acinetobacter modestus]|uniref:phage baseplate assembly protein domain-containing protein n=1 Tax=Acinetobacter modestus TaxID=1776740 RepID=UPI003019FB26
MNQFSRAIGQVRQAFFGIIARAGYKAQITGNDGEVLDEMEIIQQVGFSSWIPEGSRVVIIPLLGKSSRSVIVGSTEAPILVVAKEGETVVYDQWGHQILLHKNGIKMIGDVEIIEGGLTVEKDIKSLAEISDKKSSMQDMREIYNTHTNGNTPAPTQQM